MNVVVSPTGMSLKECNKLVEVKRYPSPASDRNLGMPFCPRGTSLSNPSRNISRMSIVLIIDFELQYHPGRNQNAPMMVPVVGASKPTGGPSLQLGMYDWSCLVY
jgi:hypothetical protein